MTRLLLRRFLGQLVLPVLLTFGLLVPPAYALGGPQVPLGEPAPEFTLPTNVGDGEISLFALW